MVHGKVKRDFVMKNLIYLQELMKCLKIIAANGIAKISLIY